MKADASLCMKLALAAAVLALTANGHTHLRDLKIGDKQYERGVCIRPYNDPVTYMFPAKDPKDEFMRCRTATVDAKAEKLCDVQAGGNVTINWFASDDKGAKGINPSHMGPCIVWMAPLESNGKGDVWWKIYEDGYDAKTSKWCIDRINANDGKLSVTIPSDLLAGKYMLRPEIIALHLAFVPFSGGKEGAEYYANCAELNVLGGGKTVPQGVPIPGIYKADTPGIVFNTSAPFTSYTIPGPKVYKVGDPGRTTKPDSGSKKPCIKKRRRRQLE
ncbi:hypothetical protein GGF42_006379 [Coemansia sp. RSA 2424]|nr:hypothetical protein GGF42_006379 [Coemansia sp. RSA 2424]